MAEKVQKRHRSFSSTEEQEQVLPLGFDLHGEDFDVYPEIQGAVLLEFIESTDDGNGAAALLRFLKTVMPEGEWVRLDALLHDPVKITKLEKIAEIVSYLVEEYSSRPTTAS